MMRLYWYEIKKFFHVRSHCVLLLLLLAFPTVNLSLSSMLKNSNRYLNGGEQISELEGEHMADEIRKEHSGIMNTSWLQKIEKQFDEIKQSGMDTWDIRYSTISDAYWIGVHTLKTKQNLISDELAPSIVKKDIETNELRFGAQNGWKTKLSILQTTALFYMAVLLYLFCNMFNQEDGAEVMDIIKSSYHGRRNLALVKLVVMFTITISLGILLYAISSVSCAFLLDMSGGNTTALLKGAFQIYSYEEVDKQAFALLLIGGLAVGSVSTLSSTLIKRPQGALCLGAAFYLIPTIIAMITSQSVLINMFPSIFLKFDNINQLLYTSWITLQNNAVFHRVPLLATVWLLLTICLWLITYYSHIHTKKLCNYRKRGFL